jgi:hypothetical protein
VYQHYTDKTSRFGDNQQRIALPPFADLNKTVLDDLLDPQKGAPYAARAVLRTQLRMSAETNSPPVGAIPTNAVAPVVLSETNVPASTNK